eukprot:TRINITY_DN8040_c0_g2_i1.p1 TRINITY_DN8040_c0_g2~~TRINITY_DN8040_c0_g2_i1.p1  ORF type:complete len:215 (-),score=15.87 TRINITY_DN8040_c0_g2_i1:247-891(-)
MIVRERHHSNVGSAFLQMVPWRLLVKLQQCFSGPTRTEVCGCYTIQATVLPSVCVATSSRKTFFVSVCAAPVACVAWSHRFCIVVVTHHTQSMGLLINLRLLQCVPCFVCVRPLHLQVSRFTFGVSPFQHICYIPLPRKYMCVPMYSAVSTQSTWGVATVAAVTAAAASSSSTSSAVASERQGRKRRGGKWLYVGTAIGLTPPCGRMIWFQRGD